MCHIILSLTLPPAVCMPAPCGKTCKKHVWGKCIIYLPKFSSCCFKSPDPICETRKAACNAARATAKGVLKAAEKTVGGSKFTLDAANGVLEGAKGVVSAAKHTLDVANAALEAAKVTYKVGADAATAIARFALKDLFNIKSITFDVTLSAASGGSFSGRVSARILGNNVKVSLKIDVRNMASMAKQLADKAIGGLSKFVG